MQNLVCKKRKRVKFEKSFHLQTAAWDVVSDSTIAALRSYEWEDLIFLTRYDFSQDEYDEEGLLEGRIASFECGKILSLHYLSDKRWICLVTTSGDLTVVREDPSEGEEKIEIVGTVDSGITAAEWSPDDELLALATTVDTVLFMTQDFECVSEYSFTPEDLQISKHVDVGWGKEETQFKGRKARTLQDPTIPKSIDKGRLSDGDTGKVSLSWRGDGAFVAINSIANGNRRVIRVLSRESVLDSVSEPVNDLTGALSWRPAGNVIAGVQKHKDAVNVVFFERNGLRHGEFGLRLSPASIKNIEAEDIQLSWNLDSTVLAVKVRDKVQLWTMKNYHYYLKQELSLATEATEWSKLLWHPEKPLRFATVFMQGINDHHFGWTIATHEVLPKQDDGIVAVIDGAMLKITSLKRANIPPPFSQHEVEPSVNAEDKQSISMVREVKIKYIGDQHVAIFALSDFEVTMHCWDLRHSARPPWLEWRCPLKNPDLAMDFDDILAGKKKQNTLHGKELAHLILPSHHNVHARDILKDLENASFKWTEASDGNRPLRPGDPKRAIRFSLSEYGGLCADKRVLVKGCTSFIETPAHLIYTTYQTLKFVHKTLKAEDLEIPPDDSDERSRQIERGAIIISAMPSIYAVVLQMPRGNLETIYPRIMVLAGIRRHIDDANYKAAFLACRKQRIDMNILHDYDPRKFFDLVSSFIEQLHKLEHIDLFLSSLKEEDVSQTMYLDTLPSQASKSVTCLGGQFDSSSKVEKICDAMLEILETLPDRVQNVITAHVCKTPPNLDAALHWIAKMDDEVIIERAVVHICFLADVNRLYDHSLGLYNLQLALQIAENAQKDPREYMPFLERMQETEPESRQHFEIDNHLGHHSKALTSLCEYASFEEVKSYVVRYSLFEEAIKLTECNHHHLMVIIHLHAQHLYSNAHYGKAGDAYRKTSEYSSASDCFRLAHRWQESLDCAQQANFSPAQLNELAKILAEDLIESKAYESAAYINEHHLVDLPNAARLYCRACSFLEAERIVALAENSALLESVLGEGVKAGRASMSELLGDCKAQLHAQVPRIKELREKKAQNPLAFIEGDTLDNGDIPDNVSLAPSEASTVGASLFTRYTNAQSGTVGTNFTRQTSKNRRREERKKARGKKGSVYEEEYLVNSIARLIERVNSTHSDIKKILAGLRRRDMNELANALTQQLQDVVRLCQASSEVVFNDVEDKPAVMEFAEGETINHKKE